MFRVGSLFLRALLAIALMIGFYALAIAVAWGLLYIPYAEVVYFDRIDPRIAFFCIVGAGLVLWSVVPRPDRFVDPGPELTRSEQPDLFKVLDSVREATGQRAPANVYLIADVNAWVSQRGGFVGIGSRRVMGLGLPLMQALTMDQFRAVVAHEFGHYHGGDTALGPWIQKTRMGILRTLQNLGGRWIQMPFTLYAKLFFRVTNAVSRQQEFSADRLAATVAGAQALSAGLKQVHRASAAFGAYWQSEYAPALNYNVRPPLGAGFLRFLDHKRVAAETESVLQNELKTAVIDPYDSHPPLPERCKALGLLDDTRTPTDSRVSATLLQRVPELERELLRIAVHPGLNDSRKVEWSEVPMLVWYPNWVEEVRTQAPSLKGATVADVAELRLDSQKIARLLVFEPGYLPSQEQRSLGVPRLLSLALAVALVRAGWRLEGELGDPITCTRGGDPPEKIDPFAVVQKIGRDITLIGWHDECVRLGIGSLPLEAGA